MRLGVTHIRRTTLLVFILTAVLLAPASSPGSSARANGDSSCHLGPVVNLERFFKQGLVTFSGNPDVVLRDPQLSDFENCIAPGHAGSFPPMQAVFSAELSTDGGTTFELLQSDVMLAGGYFPATTDPNGNPIPDDIQISDGSLSGSGTAPGYEIGVFGGSHLFVTEIDGQPDVSTLFGLVVALSPTGGGGPIFSEAPVRMVHPEVQEGTPGNCTPKLPGDADGDGFVGSKDYGIWRATYGNLPGDDLRADFNDDGTVDSGDYRVWRDNEGSGCEPPAQAPTVDSMEPASAKAGGTWSGDATITGQDFVDGAEVTFDGTPRETVWISADEVRFPMGPADFASPGSYEITVTNPGSDPSDPLLFLVTNTSASDLNGDGVVAAFDSLLGLLVLAGIPSDQVAADDIGDAYANRDGEHTPADSLYVLRVVAGFLPE